MRCGVLGAQKLRSDIDEKRPIPLLDAEVGNEPSILNPGILAEAIQTAEPADAIPDEGGDAVLARHVAGKEVDLLPEFGGKAFSCLCVDVTNNDARTFSDKRLYSGSADI
jgi:hypothetical protein